MNHEDKFSVGQKPIEISKSYPQFSVLQTRGNNSRQEEINLQRSSSNKEEQQENCFSPYVPFILNFDGKTADDEEEDFKFCEDLSTFGIYFSSAFQQRDDQRHA